MIDLKLLTSQQLQDPAQYHEIQQAVIHAISYGQGNDAKDFIHVIDDFFHVFRDLEKDEKELFSNYRKLKLYIELELFELMPEEVQVNLLSRHLFAFSRIHVDVVQKIALSVLLTDEMLENEKKETLMAALLNNQDLIGTAKIPVENKPVPPTVSNWLLKYRNTFGLKRQDSLIRMDFITRGEARSLSEEEREKLRLALDAYEEVKFTKVEIDEEKAPEQTEKAAKQSHSPLYIPRKQAIVPMTEMRRSVVPSATGGTSVQPARILPSTPSVPAAVTNTTTFASAIAPELQPQGESFQKLSDIEHVSLPMVERMGVSLQQFVETVKPNILQVQASSPQAKSDLADLWRRSPLYHLYMDMTQESMSQKKPVSEVARARTNDGRPTLSKEEFDIVSDLSRTIQ